MVDVKFRSTPIYKTEWGRGGRGRGRAAFTSPGLWHFRQLIGGAQKSKQNFNFKFVYLTNNPAHVRVRVRPLLVRNKGPLQL